jgi:hypothetical protein
VIRALYFLKVTRTGALARAHVGLFLVHASAMDLVEAKAVPAVAGEQVQQMRHHKRLVAHVGQ